MIPTFPSKTSLDNMGAAGKKKLNDLTLFFLIILTAVATHVVTIISTSGHLPLLGPKHNEAVRKNRLADFKLRKFNKTKVILPKLGRNLTKQHSVKLREFRIPGMPKPNLTRWDRRRDYKKNLELEKQRKKEQERAERQQKRLEKNHPELLQQTTPPQNKDESKEEDQFVDMEQDEEPLRESSWVGNDWYPPPGMKLFDMQQLRELFRGYSMLWLGDDAFRLVYSNVVTLLKQEALSAADLTEMEQIVAEPCRTVTKAQLNSCINIASRAYDFAETDCSQQLTSLLEGGVDVSNYDIIVFGVGYWDMGGHFCPNRLQEVVKEIGTLNVQHKKGMFLQIPIPMIWSTMGLQNAEVHEMNQKLKRIIRELNNKAFTTLDFGAGMAKRPSEIYAFPNGRRLIYTMNARMAFLQMLANHIHLHYPNEHDKHLK